MRRLVLDPGNPDSEAIRTASGVLHAGGLVAFPTETVYGLGVDPENDASVERLFRVKGRAAEKGLILHIGEPAQIRWVTREIPPEAEALVHHFFPGPLTMVLPARDTLSRRVTGGQDTVAVRMPDHPVALTLIRVFGRPIAAPSANPSGEPPPTSADQVATILGDRIDLLLDAGDSPGGVPSTLVDLTVTPPRILRHGAVPEAAVWEVLRGSRH